MAEERKNRRLLSGEADAFAGFLGESVAEGYELHDSGVRAVAVSNPWYDASERGSKPQVIVFFAVVVKEWVEEGGEDGDEVGEGEPAGEGEGAGGEDA